MRRAQAERDAARRVAIDKANQLARDATPAGQAEAAVNRIFGPPKAAVVVDDRDQLVRMVDGLTLG